jgi:hypothetical protein
MTVPRGLSAIDDLCRRRLEERRLGIEPAPAPVGDELRALIEFLGLADVLRVEPRRQAKEREERVGVEEEAELDDPPV